MGISVKGQGCHFGHDSQNGSIIVLSMGMKIRHKNMHKSENKWKKLLSIKDEKISKTSRNELKKSSYI
jgi:hypothetical protein